MTTFFTGCTHFGHDNIIRLADRPFADVNEMNEALVERWNAKVKPRDTVYHLGDFAWKDAAEWLGRLNGSKVIIIGNHDRLDDLEGHPAVTRVASILPYHEIGIASTRVVLFHYPIDDWNGRWKGHLHLHCHTHSKQCRNPNMPFDHQSGLSIPNRFPPDIKCNRFNVGVDACGFTPVSINEILDEASC
ncbi:metallophosphoesterase [Rhizobium arsenicireducens]